MTFPDFEALVVESKPDVPGANVRLALLRRGAQLERARILEFIEEEEMIDWQDQDEFTTTYGTMKQAMQESRDDMRGYLVNRLEKYFELTRFSVEVEGAGENAEWEAGYQAALALIKGEINE